MTHIASLLIGALGPYTGPNTIFVEYKARVIRAYGNGKDFGASYFMSGRTVEILSSSFRGTLSVSPFNSDRS